MRWTIGGRTFGLTDVALEEKVRLGTAEAWRFRNELGGMGMGMGMMMRMPHPMHIHSAQFRVVDRRGPAFDGLWDVGWKDTVLVMPGQEVTVVMRFDDYPGLFLYHCHILEHEDQGMMRNFEIQA
jgi:FtsP/CotA-like multicopper oxidase with cupredoxin domain